MAVELARPYCTLAQVQAETHNDDSADADKLSDAINTASRWIEDHCRADFWFHDHSSTPLSVPREWIVDNEIFLPWPIIEVTLVEDISGDNAITVDAEDYRVVTGLSANDYVESRGRIVKDGAWPVLDYKDTVRLTGEFGFTLSDDDEDVPPTNLPAHINRAAVLVASAFSGLYNRQLRDAAGQVQEMLVSDVPAEALKLLRRWKRPAV